MKHNSFWKTLPRPAFMLAPMEDVTDTSFRELVMRNAEVGKLNVVFTEFTNTDGLCHPVGREKVSFRLKVSPTEQALLKDKEVKIIAQIWGNNPDSFYKATKYIVDNYHFDGIDINMGCPVKNVVANGCCSALIDNEALAGEIIAATHAATDLPLSVNTRLGVKKIDPERWIGFLLEQPIEAIILHGRIQKQMSEGEANWTEIGKAVKIRNRIAPGIKIIGNGDVDSLADARTKTGDYGVDGIMIGRGIFKNPWLFNTSIDGKSMNERLDTLQEHIKLFELAWGDTRHFAILRRFFKIYLSDFRGASELRQRMMETNNFEEAYELIAMAHNGLWGHSHPA